LASAAAAVGVAALWATGFEGVKFLYDVISIGVSIYGTPHTDCASLKSSATDLTGKITNLAGGVLSNVVSFGIGKVVGKLSDVFRKPNIHGQCSFHGDTLVLASDGYTPIRDIEAGHDQVWAKNEITGESGWKGVLAQYSNTYKETVHTKVKDSQGREHTLTSNRIHPFFARVAAGVLLTVAAEGHVYAGDIEGGAWVDAQHLEVGDELLGSNGEWQEVVDTEIEVAELEAYNLTVDGYSTYFVAGDESAEGVWVHNKCFDSRNDFSDFDEIDTRTEFGQKQFKGPNDEIIYEGHDGRFYTKKDHPPTSYSDFQFQNVGNVNDLSKQKNIDKGGPGGEESVKLHNNMEALGFKRPADSAAHHIVPHGAYANRPSVQAIKAKLSAYGVGVNEAANGVYLPKNKDFAKPPAATHSQVHTKTYFENVARRLEDLDSAPAIRAELQKIARELTEGTFQYQP